MLNAYFQLWLVNRREEYRKNTNHHFSTHHCQLSPLSMPATGAITSDSWPWAERGGHLSVQAPGSSGHRSQSAASSTCWPLHAVSSRHIHPRERADVLFRPSWRVATEDTEFLAVPAASPVQPEDILSQVMTSALVLSILLLLQVSRLYCSSFGRDSAIITHVI